MLIQDNKIRVWFLVLSFILFHAFTDWEWKKGFYFCLIETNPLPWISTKYWHYPAAEIPDTYNLERPQSYCLRYFVILYMLQVFFQDTLFFLTRKLIDHCKKIQTTHEQVTWKQQIARIPVQKEAVSMSPLGIIYSTYFLSLMVHTIQIS